MPQRKPLGDNRFDVVFVFVCVAASMQHSDKEYVLSDYETPNAALSIGFDEWNADDLSHTLPFEQRGMPMLRVDFKAAMKLRGVADPDDQSFVR